MAFILVVDDHEALADGLATLLRLDGHEVAAAHGGPAALAFIRSRAVDLVVLDVSMPGMSGLDVLRTLRADGAVPGLPVVMFSAHDFARREALRLGAAGFADKGDTDHLLGLVDRHAARHPAPPAGA